MKRILITPPLPDGMPAKPQKLGIEVPCWQWRRAIHDTAPYDMYNCDTMECWRLSPDESAIPVFIDDKWYWEIFNPTKEAFLELEERNSYYETLIEKAFWAGMNSCSMIGGQDFEQFKKENGL